MRPVWRCAVSRARKTTWAAADLLEAWVRQYGVPKALYCDWKNVYKRRPTSREALEGIEPETQFGRMCAKLGIGIIAASSPQAKGRVERHHGTHQDRLIKKMRLKGIADYEAANRYLDEQYLPEHNAKFASEPSAGADFHRRLSKRLDLKWVFCLEGERVVSNDLVVRFENRFPQLKPQRNQALGAGARVTVQQAREGELRVVFEGRTVAFDEIAKPLPKVRPEPKPRLAPQPRTPPANHPWRAPLKPKNGRRPREEGCGNDGAVENEENPRQPTRSFEPHRSGFPRFPQPLGNRCAIPTFPQAPTTTILLLKRGHFYRANQGDISIALPRGTFLSPLDIAPARS